MNWGYCEYYDLPRDPHEQKNLAEAARRAAPAQRRLDDWLDDHVRFEPAAGEGPGQPDGSAVPRPSSAGGWATCWRRPTWRRMLQSDSPLPVAARGRAPAGGAAAAPGDPRGGAGALARRRRGAAPLDRGGRARLGDRTRAGPGAQILAAAGDRDLRVQAALALARARDPSGVPVLAAALDDCQENVLGASSSSSSWASCATGGVPALLAHLPEVQNRREMVQALGDIGDPSWPGSAGRAAGPDEYVPVRVEAAGRWPSWAATRPGGPRAVGARGARASVKEAPAPRSARWRRGPRGQPRPDRAHSLPRAARQ
jgi:hypothetical protein